MAEEKRGKHSVCFQPENACLLGLAYEMGLGTESDQRMTEFYYKVAAYNGGYGQGKERIPCHGLRREKRGVKGACIPAVLCYTVINSIG